MSSASLSYQKKPPSPPEDDALCALVKKMTLVEKIGQMSQWSTTENEITEEFQQALQQGQVGSVLNQVNLSTINQMQRIAVEESRLGIPLLVGRDVIHGFKTIFPIPLGQAASWCPQLVERCAKASAMEAAKAGINWTFAPMIDISRDPRWGRIAESLGEDPFLCSQLATAMVTGFQGGSLAKPGTIAACAKHFAGYGASESGKDYNTTSIPETELRNVYFPPFLAAQAANVRSFMTSFSDLNGIPASANQWLMKTVLRQEWQFDGIVVSDWDSILQLISHGVAANESEAASLAFNAGIEMEMNSNLYRTWLPDLIKKQPQLIQELDKMVYRILKLKAQLGLFKNPYVNPTDSAFTHKENHLQLAKECAIKSCVLLKNDKQALPLCKKNLASLAVIGPLADDQYEQLGTWIFDADETLSVTPLKAIEEYLAGKVTVNYCKAMENTRSLSKACFDDAVALASRSPVTILFLGEESILSGEAHCRSRLDLPGRQQQLIEAIAKTATSIVLVIMAGRPLTLEPVLDKVDSLIYAWHPGTMAGSAICELLFGLTSPSGKLPVTFPRSVGQIPIYYGHKNSGRPAQQENFVKIEDIPVRAPQTSFGMTATHLDVHFSPLFSFGFGLSYSQFKYTKLNLNKQTVSPDEDLSISVIISNIGDYAGDEIVQLYTRDLVASITRPVKELKRFKRIHLKSGESRKVEFQLSTDDLAFYNQKSQRVTESGKFLLWVGGSSQTSLVSEFNIIVEDSGDAQNV